jgi:hypothetical protein
MRQLAVVSFLVVLSLSVLNGTACGASIPAQDTLARERALVAENYVNQKLQIWQKRLRLENWVLTVRLVRSWELKPKTLGNIHWDKDRNTALIKVLDPVDYKLPFPDVLKDLETTIVHEMVHLHLAALPRSEATRKAEESVVTKIAGALLELERK